MTEIGHQSTVPVTVDEMLLLTRAAARGSTRPLVVADLPFMSYQVSDQDAMVASGRFVKEGGADAIKMEGAGPTLDRILAVTRAGMPVMGHLGLTPQTATALGGFKAQGRTAAAALQLLHDALAIEAAGAFALVLECVPAPGAQAVTERLAIPTIGIGAGAGCDGQVLVYHDLLGYGDARAPRFVKRYADLHGAALRGVQRSAAEGRSGAFPALEHTYAMPAEELAAFEDALQPANPLFDCPSGSASCRCARGPASRQRLRALDQLDPVGVGIAH